MDAATVVCAVHDDAMGQSDLHWSAPRRRAERQGQTRPCTLMTYCEMQFTWEPPLLPPRGSPIE
ncbi:MAG: hypothetical protein KatS3mg111_1387 [Pirellulaceae bacterium]|nr:MAG: hypothetical protein KatS3mg111_1387 [Pirellulaceae bacterium]